MQGEFGSPVDPIARARYQPEWPNLFVALYDYERYDLERKKAQFADGINRLQRSMELQFSTIQDWQDVQYKAHAELNKRLDIIVDRMRKDNVSLKKLPPAFLVESPWGGL